MRLRKLPPPAHHARQAPGRIDHGEARALFHLKNIRFLTAIMIAVLILSGTTAIPLQREVDALVVLLGYSTESAPDLETGLAHWVLTVRQALHHTSTTYPFLFYGTDWLAFGHFAIAIIFIGVWRDPLRNEWIVTAGKIICILLLPYAILFGMKRHIPWFWQIVDCSFGAGGWFVLHLISAHLRVLKEPPPRDPRFAHMDRETS